MLTQLALPHKTNVTPSDIHQGLMVILEICANSFQSARNAEVGGADRIELCANLEAGGITPSFGLVATVKQRLKIPVHVLIRPRAGDFVYDEDDYDVMLEDIKACRKLECEGVVVGILTEQNSVDVSRLTRLVEAAKPMAVTFHRAFDDCRDQLQALEDIVQAGCSRILTSGGADNALEGSRMISELIRVGGQRIGIMPGAGITAKNVRDLIELTGATEYHASAKIVLDPTSVSRFQSSRFQTSADEVKALIEILKH